MFFYVFVVTFVAFLAHSESTKQTYYLLACKFIAFRAFTYKLV